MTEEKKLTDEEIVKAFELCVMDGVGCAECPYSEYAREGFGYCNGDIEEDILDLIHRLQSENKRLTEEKRLTIEKIKSKPIARLKKDEILWAYQMDCEMYKSRVAELQKQVNELKDERENMQAEILRFEDMKFTQEHCDLYSENETLKQWLKRLNADLEHERVWGKIQTKQAVKDTAKEILQELFDEATSNVSETVELTTFQIEQFAERYGVEVE